MGFATFYSHHFASLCNYLYSKHLIILNTHKALIVPHTKRNIGKVRRIFLKKFRKTY